MRNSAFVAVVLISTVVFTSCNEVFNNKLSFGYDSFGEQFLYYANAQKYILDDTLFFGAPYEIRIHPDGFIVIKDHLLEQQIVVIDLEDGNTERLVWKGRGPSELISARDLQIYNGDIWVLGLQERKVIRISPDRSTRKFEIAETYDLSGNSFLRALPVTGNKFLILSNPTSGKRMEIISNKGEILREVGSFPDVSTSQSFKPNNAFFQSNITVSPDNKHTAVVYLSVDYIDIYDGNMELEKRLRGPMGVESEFIEVERPGGAVQFIQRPSFTTYGSTVSNNEMFFVLFYGIENKPDDDLTYAHRIFSFDWNGKPLKSYNFDTPIVSFDVDSINNKLYCITLNSEHDYEILIFDL